MIGTVGNGKRGLATSCLPMHLDAGFGTGESRDQLREALAAAVPQLPPHLPRLSQGIGAPDAVLAAVEHGVDLFDSGYAHLATAAGAALTYPAGADPAAAASAAGRDAAGGSHAANEAVGSSGYGSSSGNGAAASQNGAASGTAASGGRGADEGLPAAAAVNLRDLSHRASQEPLLAGCSCYTCSRWGETILSLASQTGQQQCRLSWSCATMCSGCLHA